MKLCLVQQYILLNLEWVRWQFLGCDYITLLRLQVFSAEHLAGIFALAIDCWLAVLVWRET
jgi:hypothetical protein